MDIKEKAKIRLQKWRESHREETRAWQRDYRKTHPDKPDKRTYTDRGEAYKAYHKEYRKSHRQSLQAAAVEYAIRKYGLTPEDFEQKKTEQKGLCAICKKAPLQIGNKRSLYIDHDHETGQVRDLLCMKCNATLGMVDEEVSNLEAMIDYLKRWGK